MTPRSSGSSLTSTASCTAYGGVVESTGEQINGRALAERVGWAAGLIQRMTAGLLAAHWTAEDVARLASGSDQTGRRLPPQACKALRRLGWTAEVPEGVRVNDRIVRMAEEAAGRTLRSAAWRVGLVDAVVSTWPADPDKRTPQEWDALRDAIPGGQGQAVATGILRGRTRQVVEYARRNGRLPADVFELEAPPRAPRQLLLAPCDRQQATLARCPDDHNRYPVLRLQLPTRSDPRSYRDWTWVAIRVALPPAVPPTATLHLPTLRVASGGEVRVDLPFSHAVPAASRAGHTVALGVDWGLNCLLSAGVVRLAQDSGGDQSCTTGNRTVMFRAAGILAKADRVRRAGEAVSAKANQHKLLLDGRAAHGLPDDPALQARHDLLTAERDRIAARRRHLNTALANAGAKWLAEHAHAARATVIYFEDLRDLEAKGKGRNLNTRLSQTVRGQIVDATRHAAAKHGIAVVTVPARETSKRCPRCLTVLRHSKAPDRPGLLGWKWARCSGCGWAGDRDAGAWQRIAARGLLHQHQTIQDRAGGHLLVRKVAPELDARSAVQPAPANGQLPPETSPTAAVALLNQRRSRRRSRSRSSRGAPRQRRTAPSPPRHPSRPRPPRSRSSEGRGGNRPEGRAPQVPTTATVSRSQAAAPATEPGGWRTTIGTPRRIPHRPRGARLGAGFHRGAHTTTPRYRHRRRVRSYANAPFA